jgi:hypothetical protein
LKTLYVYVILMRDICHHGYSSFHLYVHGPVASTKICNGYVRYKDESIRRCYYFTNYFSRSCDSRDQSWYWKCYILWVTLPASCKKQMSLQAKAYRINNWSTLYFVQMNPQWQIYGTMKVCGRFKCNICASLSDHLTQWQRQSLAH